ncbi:MAG: hypothetical protein EP330_20390 [Deltaproteobacteria bacterium]|nr:MAG: hypothetical protein EP330_20390 [Deltaproteobacteria bacterium]
MEAPRDLTVTADLDRARIEWQEHVPPGLLRKGLLNTLGFAVIGVLVFGGFAIAGPLSCLFAAMALFAGAWLLGSADDAVPSPVVLDLTPTSLALSRRERRSEVAWAEVSNVGVDGQTLTLQLGGKPYRFWFRHRDAAQWCADELEHWRVRAPDVGTGDVPAALDALRSRQDER